MDQQSEAQRREYFRLRYPKSERPRAKILDRDFRICEISEQGTRILFTNSHPVSRGVTIKGTIRFHDGVEIPIEGRVLRLDDNELVAKLTKGPDLKRMTAEQIYLRKKYPGLFSKTKDFSFVR
ncbi:PilZ domain-containing protein [Vibrio algarum]|uniref:PilZ domain-containing protein n=1 Tax=Vibrio algarum TaxID=3020714 RepID=A0ABT4YPE8_9VIBR|nr:PilZ domain-containing protein [Vibrio sp. KJ40-1]MDB1122939.1 PilZ domain-containing protein [Vibrio sp. KJ40-1]